jgi:hypothetical protein
MMFDAARRFQISRNIREGAKFHHGGTGTPCRGRQTKGLEIWERALQQLVPYHPRQSEGEADVDRKHEKQQAQTACQNGSLQLGLGM